MADNFSDKARQFPRGARAVAIGALTAVVFPCLTGSVLLLFHPVMGIDSALWATLRLAPYLVLFGGGFGAFLLRGSPLNWRRLTLVGTLSTVGAFSLFFGLQVYSSRRWMKAVIHAEIPSGVSELELIKRLGQPRNVTFRSKDASDAWSNDCSRGRAVKQLEYVPKDGGPSRTFYVDVNGFVVCETFGARHIWVWRLVPSTAGWEVAGPPT